MQLFAKIRWKSGTIIKSQRKYNKKIYRLYDHDPFEVTIAHLAGLLSTPGYTTVKVFALSMPQYKNATIFWGGIT